jgi:dsDNA-specific endonuclease/ATPase MutS2
MADFYVDSEGNTSRIPPDEPLELNARTEAAKNPIEKEVEALKREIAERRYHQSSPSLLLVFAIIVILIFLGLCVEALQQWLRS